MNKVYKEIQSEFFYVLESSKLFKEVKEVEKGKFALSQSFPIESTALRVKTSKGWQPTPVKWVEDLLEDIFNFWEKKAKILYRHISESKLDFIQTQPILFQKGIRKFGCFFNGILVPDQLLILYGEHFTDTRPFTDWQALVLSVVRCGVTYLENKELLLPSNNYPRIIIVPTKRIIEKKFEKQAYNAVLTISKRFLSEICNKKINHPEEFVETWIESGEQSMNKELLNLVYNRYGALNFHDYFYIQRKQTISEHGALTTTKNEPPQFQMIIDVSARFSEFERSHGEAFILGHEAEIPDDDLSLFEWWFNESSKTLSSISGTRLSESEIIKLGIQSDKMSFLRGINIDDLIKLIETDPVEKLRDHFKFSRIKLKRINNPSLEKSINIVGNFMEEKINEFQLEIKNLEKHMSKGIRKEWIDLGATMVLTAASAIFPPLSAFSALYGGNISSINKKNKMNKKILKSIKEKPMATLANWKSVK